MIPGMPGGISGGSGGVTGEFGGGTSGADGGMAGAAGGAVFNFATPKSVQVVDSLSLPIFAGVVVIGVLLWSRSK